MNKKNVIAVVRFDDRKDSLNFSHACIEGGINLLEVITIKKNSFEVLSELSGLDKVTAGAGTVLDLESAKQSYKAGAKFIVSPHTDRDIIKFTKSRGLVSIAGAYTSSEIVKAYNLGADYVKIFPASLGGPGYVKAIKEALPFINVLVTGGINTENCRDYFNAGASLLGISTALTGSGVKLDMKEVVRRSKEFINAVN